MAILQQGERVKSGQTGFDITLPPRAVGQARIVSLFGDNETNEGSVAQLTYESAVPDVHIDYPDPPNGSIGNNQCVINGLGSSVSRNGNGRITSTPPGIDCGGTCSAQFDNGQVSLSAAPDAGWTFAGWSGACSGTGACSVSLSSDVSVSAAFTASPPPPDECAGLAPTAPGAPLKVRVATSSGPTCHAGNADGQGNLALVYDLTGSLFAHFFDGSGKPLGNFIWHDEAMPVAEQIDGYHVQAGRARSIQWLTGRGQVAAETPEADRRLSCSHSRLPARRWRRGRLRARCRRGRDACR